jgi:hypothetical protein
LDGVPTNQVRKVYGQFVKKFSENDGLKNADNEAKQNLAELAILDGIEIAVAVKSSDQNNKTKAKTKKKVA